MPEHDAHLPDPIEAFVPHAGLELQRRGTRPFPFKTSSGAVTVPRVRISHHREGSIEIPAATARDTPHRLASTQHLRDAAWDQMGAHSAGDSRADVGQDAGDEDLRGRRTLLDIGPQGGERLITAQRQRARSVLEEAPEAGRASLGPVVADAVEDECSDVPPCDATPEEPAAWERAQAGWAARGCPGCEPELNCRWTATSRAADPGCVIVEPDEVQTKAQPSTGRQGVWTSTAVVLVAGFGSAFAGATAGDLWLQVPALLVELEVLSGGRRPLVLGDGASWIRTWFEGLGISPQAMSVCWWHLRKRCHEQIRAAGGPQDRGRASEDALRGRLGEGTVDAATAPLPGALEWVRDRKAVAEWIGYLEQRRASLPDSQERHRVGLWMASARVERFTAWAVSGRCKQRGMSRSPQGVLALAALGAARRHGELDHRRQDRRLPERKRPEPIRKVA